LRWHLECRLFVPILLFLWHEQPSTSAIL
jgi:hypothetical protein